MKNNVGMLDVAIRYVVIIALGVLFGLTQWFVLIPIAIIIFITAVSGVCPLYSMLGWNSITKEEQV